MKNLSLIIILLVGLLYGLQLIECNMSYHKQLDIQLEKRDIINKKKTSKTSRMKENSKQIYQIFSKINRLSGMRKPRKEYMT